MFDILMNFAIPTMTATFVVFLVSIFIQVRKMTKTHEKHETKTDERHTETYAELRHVSSSVAEVKSMLHTIGESGYNRINININVGVQINEALPKIGFEKYDRRENEHGTYYFTGMKTKDLSVNFLILVQKGIEEILISAFSFLVKDTPAALLPAIMPVAKDNVIGALNYDTFVEGTVVKLEYVLQPPALTNSYLDRIMKTLAREQLDIKKCLQENSKEFKNVNLKEYSDLTIIEDDEEKKTET